MRCLSSPRRQPAEASRSCSAHSSPHSTGESLVYPDAPSHWSLSERKVRSPPPAPPTSLGAPLPAAACASLGSDAPPAGRCSLCQLATHGIDCPGLPCLERVALAAWLGRGARHPRRFVDPSCVSLLGSPAGAASIPKGKKVGSADFLYRLVETIDISWLLLAVKKTEATWKKPPSSGLWRRWYWTPVEVKKTLSGAGPRE